jgi:pimeloyl-ACP methyl ester carboxylesterase
MHKENGFTQKVVKIGEQKIYYQISPNPGKPVVCIHGFLDSAVGFRRIASFLGNHYQMFVVDIPSFGKSKLPENKYLFQIDLFAQMIYDSIRNLDLKDITLLGHSMGGLIAQHIALLDKDEKRIDSIVLLASANSPHPQKEEMRKILFPKNKYEFRNLLEHLYHSDRPEPGDFMLNTLVHIWNSKQYLYMAENTIAREKEIFIGKKIENIDVPILLISGKQDILTTEEDMKRIHSWLKKGELIILDKAKHAIHLEYPERISHEIIHFLQKNNL